MRKGDRVRWSEAHCRREADQAAMWIRTAHPEGIRLRQKTYRNAYEHARSMVGRVVNVKRILDREICDVALESPIPGFNPYPVHTVPAELLEVAS